MKVVTSLIKKFKKGKVTKISNEWGYYRKRGIDGDYYIIIAPLA